MWPLLPGTRWALTADTVTYRHFVRNLVRLAAATPLEWSCLSSPIRPGSGSSPVWLTETQDVAGRASVARWIPVLCSVLWSPSRAVKTAMAPACHQQNWQQCSPPPASVGKAIQDNYLCTALRVNLSSSQLTGNDCSQSVAAPRDDTDKWLEQVCLSGPSQRANIFCLVSRRSTVARASCTLFRLTSSAIMQRASITTSSGLATKRCWRCDKPVDASPRDSENKVAVCERCGSIQPISTDVNFFSLFNLHSPGYDLDLEELRRQYLRLQQNMHPDMNVHRSKTETEYSVDNASIINSAYNTLRDPYQRALYLLRMQFDMTIDEGNIQTEPELLLEIMELNEDIELAASDKDSLAGVTERVETNIQSIVEDLKRAFADNNGAHARQLTVRFSYYNSALSKLKSQLVKM